MGVDASAGPARGGQGCVLWPLTVIVGVLFVAMTLSVPMVFVMAPSLKALALVLPVTVLLAAFLGYVLRGLVRTLRGDPDAPLVPPWLVTPLAVGLGLMAVVAGVAGLLGVGGNDGYSASRAIGSGALFIVYGLSARRKPAKQNTALR